MFWCLFYTSLAVPLNDVGLSCFFCVPEMLCLHVVCQCCVILWSRDVRCILSMCVEPSSCCALRVVLMEGVVTSCLDICFYLLSSIYSLISIICTLVSQFLDYSFNIFSTSFLYLELMERVVVDEYLRIHLKYRINFIVLHYLVISLTLSLAYGGRIYA